MIVLASILLQTIFLAWALREPLCPSSSGCWWRHRCRRCRRWQRHVMLEMSRVDGHHLRENVPIQPQPQSASTTTPLIHPFECTVGTLL